LTVTHTEVTHTGRAACEGATCKGTACKAAAACKVPTACKVGGARDRRKEGMPGLHLKGSQPRTIQQQGGSKQLQPCKPTLPPDTLTTPCAAGPVPAPKAPCMSLKAHVDRCSSLKLVAAVAWPWVGAEVCVRVCVPV